LERIIRKIIVTKKINSSFIGTNLGFKTYLISDATAAFGYKGSKWRILWTQNYTQCIAFYTSWWVCNNTHNQAINKYFYKM